MQQLLMRIGGAQRQASNGQWFESIDPFTAKPWARAPRGTEADADSAVRAADTAMREGPWASMTASDRGVLMFRLADLIAKNAERLADLEVQDNGKLRSEMLAQMRYLPRWFQYYGGLADKIEGSVTPIDKPGMFHYISYEPIGVVAAITAFNSPLLLSTWKIAPALAAGNTVVVKPSEHTPASMIALADLFDEAGFPPGVVNVVTGFGNEVGKALIEHPLVARVAFTGGDAGGRVIARSAAETFKRVSLELGGKSPNIIFEDADLDDAIKGAVTGIFAASGQTCMAGSRVLVHSSVHDEFVQRLVAFMKDVKLGDPRKPETQVGPIATHAQYEKILHYMEIAKQEGAHCVLGGGRATRPECGDGWFVEPTIFTNISNNMRIAQEEVFGPVLCVLKFDTEEQAIEIANDVLYGLAAGIWTRSLERAISLPKKLKAGTVWVNAYRVVSYMAPFGGYKHSGLGRENGMAAVHEYLETKSVFINPKPGIPNPFILG